MAAQVLPSISWLQQLGFLEPNHLSATPLLLLNTAPDFIKQAIQWLGISDAQVTSSRWPTDDSRWHKLSFRFSIEETEL